MLSKLNNKTKIIIFNNIIFFKKIKKIIKERVYSGSFQFVQISLTTFICKVVWIKAQSPNNVDYELNCKMVYIEKKNKRESVFTQKTNFVKNCS